MILLLDDDAQCTLDDFIQVNTKEPDVVHISQEEVEQVSSLNPGETTFVGLTKVHRLN